jgi:hypothetical protein
MGARIRAALVAVAAAAAASRVIASAATMDMAPEYHRYVVVGAGPGGLQLGHYMDTAERDYVILDKVRLLLITALTTFGC